MTSIKYIFRDFWWVVATLDYKKNSHMTLIAKAYDIDRKELRKYIERPFEIFRRGEIGEQKFREMLSKNIWTKTPAAAKKVFHICPSTYAVLRKSIINFINKLKKLWYISVLLSDVYPPTKQITKKLWRYDDFDKLILSCDIGLSKFDDVTNWTTKIFDYALKKYNVQPDEALFIDDLEKNCLIAQKAWMKTLIVESPRQTVRDLKKILNIYS